MKKVAVIMGSDSDWPVVKGTCAQLEAFGIPYEAHILSAHRTPAAAADFAMKGGAMDGLDALLSTVQMPSGIPVAAVAINGAKNAAVLAAQILAVSDDGLAAKLDGARDNMAAQIAEKEAKLQTELNESAHF